MPPKSDKHKEAYLAWRQTDHGREVYDEMRSLALNMAKRGFTVYSAQTLACVVRHHRQLQHGPAFGEPKVNNNYVSFLAREITETTPQLPEGFLRFRGEDNHEPPPPGEQIGMGI